jgi:uncharacterized protein YjiS (DUF1127 family)
MSVLQEVATASEREEPQLRRIWRIVGLWVRRRHDRDMLRSLSARDLQDFCPRLSEAEAEMNKPFWRA